MENNIFKNIKNKLASCFMKKEEKLLLKMAKYKNFGENVASSSLALLIGFIASLFGFAILFDVFTVITGINLSGMINVEGFILFCVIFNITLSPLLSRIIKNAMYGEDFLKVIKKHDVENFVKIFEKNKLEKSDFYKQLIDMVYDIKVDVEELNEFNKEISKKISKEELNIIFKDIELNKILNENKNITYGYLFKLIEKIENKLKVEKENSEYKTTLEFQEKIFINENEKEQTNLALKEKIQAFEN